MPNRSAEWEFTDAREHGRNENETERSEPAHGTRAARGRSRVASLVESGNCAETPREDDRDNSTEHPKPELWPLTPTMEARHQSHSQVGAGC